jgi:hypothetical protein
MLIVRYPIRHVTCMDHVECRRADGVAMHASVRRERLERLQTKGILSARRGGGRACRAGVDDEPEPEYEPQPQMDMVMEVEHQTEDDAEAEEEVDDDDDDEQQRRQRRVPEPESEQLDDYPGGPYDTTVLTRYHVHVAMMAADGEVR